jgi:AraC-like DNA-binding protein
MVNFGQFWALFYRREAAMSLLSSAIPSPQLRPYVRAYAYRKWESTDLAISEPVPPQLEQVLNFEFGSIPGVLHRQSSVESQIWIGGAQTVFPGHLVLYPGVESFAIFFQPAGWSCLFRTPIYEFTNCIYDAPSVVGTEVRSLWNQLGETSSFEMRVKITEEFLIKRIPGTIDPDGIAKAVTYIFRRSGAVSVSRLAERESIGLRQFERRFRHGTGASPKTFARVARFQAAVDAKLARPHRTWLDIAHTFGYHDQMHMVRDFKHLGLNTPSGLVKEMGDVRPPALTEANR